MNALQEIRQRNEEYMKNFSENRMVQLFKDGRTPEGLKEEIIQYGQVWSDTFQHVVTMRAACENDPAFRPAAEEHLAEEIGHNQLLQKLHSGPPKWDPVVAASSSWFVHQMQVLSSPERSALAHLVLEGAGTVALQAGSLSFPESEYFALHDEADEGHMEMGYAQLAAAPHVPAAQILEILEKGWKMVFELCNRIAQCAETAYSLRADDWQVGVGIKV
ncbi:hypothetical protein [Streptomyces sp. NPDC051909]|uniref:hypothetical protein n=1 Tax=Streptomyces sp. NPDC051909 TaxID=3154944 RepID=UPI003442832A